MPRTRRLHGWNLQEKENWDERKAQMNARTIERLATKPRAEAEQVQPEPKPAEIDPLACTKECPVCHGEGFTIDHTESAIDCPRWTERKRKAGGND